MKILLVNSNPVVSRLFLLCTRDANITLDEAEDIETIDIGKRYDLLFIDDALYSERFKTFIADSDIGKKVLISYGPEYVHGFDLILKKPFLPSQILKIMENTTVSEARSENEESVIFSPPEAQKSEEREAEVIPSIFPLAAEEIEEEEEKIISENPHILDSREIEKIKDLLDMEEETILPFEEVLPDDVVEQRKVEAITAQLIADGVEIVDEEEIVEALHSEGKSKEKKKREETGPFSKKEFDAVQKGVWKALLKLKPKKVKKLLKGKKVKLKLRLKDGV